MTRRFLVLLLAVAIAAIGTWVAPPTAPGAADAALPVDATTRAAPSAPRQVQAVAGDERATLTWKAPTGGRAPTGYRVQRRTSGGRWVTVRDLRPSARRAVVRGLPNGQTARLRVAARSADGIGAYSSATVMLPLTLQVAAGEDHTCAVRADSTVVCFGYNGNGQLGDGTTSSSSTPVTVRTAAGAVLRRVVAIDAGGSTTCALTRGGEAWCWGGNDDRNLGDGTDVDRSSAAPVVTAAGTPVRSVVGVTVGVEHTCMWLADTTARCVGSNSEGELGRGENSAQDIGVPVPFLSGGTPLRGIVEMEAIEAATCLRLTSGSVVCVGFNAEGQLGLGDTTRRLQPTAMLDGTTSAPVAGARGIDGGDRHVCLRLANGTSRCTGRNTSGQLGNLSNDNASVLDLPLAAADTGYSTPNDVTDVVAGSAHTCVVRRTGRLMCTGGNSSGQLFTIDTVDSDRLRPALLAPTLPLGGVISATAGKAHTCVRLTNGSVRCVGYNDDGQLGIGFASIREVTPVRPIGL